MDMQQKNSRSKTSKTSKSIAKTVTIEAGNNDDNSTLTGSFSPSVRCPGADGGNREYSRAKTPRKIALEKIANGDLSMSPENEGVCTANASSCFHNVEGDFYG